ncbi:MAG: YegS/Rv2252/BmrU family lipid kinase [Oscillospiraceae bacterium]|nr:YegS/Rv2252/BmrU family lipid kinase [Oscillospiraceae bacterium]
MQQERSSSPLSRRALLIINPVSGKRIVLRYIPQIIRIFMNAGYLVTTVVTSRRGEAVDYARDLGGGFDLICCTGGDGTLNETITGLAQGQVRVPIGYIPCGSTNDFAVSRALSTDILTAARQAASGEQKRYDIGLFGDQYFSYVAAFGAFSWLSYTTDQNLKNVLGHTAYILDGIKDLSKIKPLHVKMTVDGTVYEDDYLFGAVCNSTSIAGTLELPATLVDTCDGIFEVLLIKVPKTLLDLDLIVRGLLTQDYSSPFIVLTQGREILAENPPDLVWALDGESSIPCEKVRITPVPSFLTLQS